MKTINIGVLAHVDAGKTSLVERLLFETNIIRQLGSIEKGTTVMDSLALEKERGISIKNSYTSFFYEDLLVNLIDTPGHYDFVDEVESAFAILDVVVLVISSLTGVQSQTKKIWQLSQTYAIPVIIFVNKCDHANHDQAALKANIQQFLTQSVVEVGASFTEDELYTLVEGDESLETKLLEETISLAEINQTYSYKFNQGHVFPLIFGSAKENSGINDLLTTLKLIEDTTQKEGLSGLIFKIVYHPKLGKGSYLRLFKGSVKTKEVIQLKKIDGQLAASKITQIKHYQQGKIGDSSTIGPGEIGIVYGLTNATVGDRIGSYEETVIKKTPALFMVTVSETTGRWAQLRQAIFELSEEHPALTYEVFDETEEVQFSVLGQIQADTILYELSQRYSLVVNYSQPMIIYKERPSIEGIGFERYTMPKPSWAVVKLLIEPMPKGFGYQFVNQVDNDKLLPRYHGQLADSLKMSLLTGRLGWEVTDLRVTLIDGESHREHTHPLDFALATPIALQQGLQNAEMVLLEPTLLIKITISSELLSKIVPDIIKIEGRIIKEIYEGEQSYLEAIVPLATFTAYSRTFFQKTKGEGLIEQSFYDYQDCPSDRYVTKTRGGIDPLDRDKWILHRRGSIK